MELKKGFIFDRDGVINELVNDNNTLRPPFKLDELKINNEIIKFGKYLIKKDYILFIVSNQPDVKRKNLKINNLNKINENISNELNLKEIVCEIEDNEKIKKPSPHMINQLITKYNLDPLNTWLIGDRWVDILAANRAQIKCILLEKDYSYLPTSIGESPDVLKIDIIIKDLSELSEQKILKNF
tara:strand:+ start:104 stop:655 length:552 start_codon:yes stop_codon:yes gene_type:complete